jgi:purine-binding chemotaxis protein CheW
MNEILDEARVDAAEDARRKIDFKMVTFSLAGRDYGIDIMRVKEISKVSRFTYVPNTFSFVRGVHNLRGEIISVIDMRLMFNLENDKSKKAADKIENVLILGLKENKIGIIVDSISKVVGIASETIQPPPPLFKDINVKYINGVVEYDEHLYLILDVERIFEDEAKEVAPSISESEKEVKVASNKAPVDEAIQDIQFISDTLLALKKFYVTDLNKAWVEQNLDSWKNKRSHDKKSFQLANIEDTDDFLKDFYSPCTGKFFDEEYKNLLLAVLPDTLSGSINAWNTGCGKGFESYSLGIVLKIKYPQARIKVWANDISLLDISTAPSISLKKEELPPYFEKGSFVNDSPKGFQFSQEIKDAIYFEYHDVLNQNVIPAMDLIFARDLISFLKPGDQDKVIAEFSNKLKPGGMLIIGKNERIIADGFEAIGDKEIVIYVKRGEK